MKTLIITLTLIVLTSFGLNAQTAYEKIMTEAIQTVTQARSADTIRQAVNQLERIAARETDKWEPLYYAGFGYAMLANKATDGSEKDKLLDQAMESTTKALTLAPAESELVTLKGFVQMLRVTVDPATRGPEYAPMAIRIFQEAIGMDPSNPRPQYLLGQMEIGTAQFFGNDITPGCKRIQESLKLFDEQPEDAGIAPSWGRSWALASIKACE